MAFAVLSGRSAALGEQKEKRLAELLRLDVTNGILSAPIDASQALPTSFYLKMD